MKFTEGQARAFASWSFMVQRCCDPSNLAYANYGGRGISICDRWRDPWLFLADMGERPPRLTLGRVDNDGNYEPGNCRWETALQQGSNTRRVVRIGAKIQAQVARDTGLSDATISRRRTAGMPLLRPAYFKRNKLDRDRVASLKALFRTSLTNVAIAERFGVSHTTVAQIRRGKQWADVAPSEQLTWD